MALPEEGNDQQYSVTVGGDTDDTLNEWDDSGTYFQDDGEGYTSECN